MRALAALILLTVAPALASAQKGGWNLYGADGTYQGSISREDNGTLDRYGSDGSYQGSYDRGSDGWNAYDANGQYQGRISGQGDPRIKSGEGLPAVIGGQ